MLYANDINGIEVLATRDLQRGVYKCKECGEKLIFKNGKIISAHFAHPKNELCEYYIYSKGESEAHRNYKKALYNKLKKSKNVEFISMEYRVVDGRIADIYIKYKNGFKYVIEIQQSSTTLKEYIERTQDYNKYNIPVFWVWDIKFIMNNDGTEPKDIRGGSFFERLMDKQYISNFGKETTSISFFIDNEYTLYKGVRDFYSVTYQSNHSDYLDRTVYKKYYKLTRDVKKLKVENFKFWNAQTEEYVYLKLVCYV